LPGSVVDPKIVTDLVAHASVAIMLDRYSHLAMAMYQEAATVPEEALEELSAHRVRSVVGPLLRIKGLIYRHN
jgi:hypothetical protein